MKPLRYAVSLFVLFLFWYILAYFLGPRVLPAPGPVFIAFFKALGTQEFWQHATASALRAVISLVLAFVCAFPLGIALGASRRVHAWCAPLVFMTYPVPKIVFLPVLLVLFGLGEMPKILLIALTAGYQILVVTMDSVRNLDKQYLTAFASLSKSRIQRVRHVLIPAALPAAITSLRIATGTAVAVLFLAESFVTDTGLGFVIMDAWGIMDLPRMFTGILGMSFLGLILYEACNLLERLCCAWVKA